MLDVRVSQRRPLPILDQGSVRDDRCREFVETYITLASLLHLDDLADTCVLGLGTGSTGAIRHVMMTSRPKRAPGEVKDSSGIGNGDSDAGQLKLKFGYLVLGLYR